MFSNWASLTAPEDLTDKERPPPPLPTKIDFPAYTPGGEVAPFTTQSITKFAARLLGIKKAQEISADLVQALNLRVTRDVTFSEILPRNASLYLPPLNTSQSDTEAQTAKSDGKQSIPAKMLGNGLAVPGKAKYDALRSELSLDNEDAYREILRLPPLDGKPKLKLRESRKFWLGLERMAQYWDTSLDQYYEKAEDEMMEDAESAHDPTPDEMQGDKLSTNQTKKDGDQANRAHTGKRTFYKGRRTGAGSEMPEDCRDETVKAFVDLVAWSFGCQTMMPNVPPRLAVQNMLLPVRHTFSLARSPQDRQIARKGILEGPLLVIQCRGEVQFHNEGEQTGDGQTEVCDLLREVGGMLLLAQERARDGCVETRAGEGKWWTMAPRWGGAENNVGPEVDEVKEPLSNGNANKKLKTDTMLPPKSYPYKHLPAKRLSMADRWKIVQPGPSTWDRKLKYMQIGKDPMTDFDDIYMVSSVCHHIAVLHLRVHPTYLQWLVNGAPEAVKQAAGSIPAPWQVLHLQRTRWYDLFNAEDRRQVMDGLWGIVGWLMRADEQNA